MVSGVGIKMLTQALAVLSTLGAGMLAGEEFVVCYAVRSPLADLEPQPSIQLRQGLIRRLRVLVPSIFGLTALSGTALTIVGGGGPALAARAAGLVLLFVFITVTMLGTVPINQAALSWAPASPPEGWRLMVQRWERLDIVRTWAAILAFCLFALGLALR
jgi:uncharacterized membrane protein